MRSRTEEDGGRRDLAVGILRGQGLVELEGREPDGHLGDDTGEDRSETLVEGQRALLLDDITTDTEETSPLHTGSASALRKLHADLFIASAPVHRVSSGSAKSSYLDGICP